LLVDDLIQESYVKVNESMDSYCVPTKKPEVSFVKTASITLEDDSDDDGVDIDNLEEQDQTLELNDDIIFETYIEPKHQVTKK